MGKIRRVLRCYNCGAVLQSKKKSEKGFIDAQSLNAPNAQEQVLFCHTCHEKMKAVNTGMLAKEVDDDILKILSDAVASDAYLVWVIDLFTFNGSFDKDLVKKVKNLKIAVIGTRFNLFPKSVKEEKITSYIQERFNEVGLKPDAIHIFGDLNKVDFHEMFKKLHQARAGHDVYVLGSSVSLKHSLVEHLLKVYNNPSKRVIRADEYPGTESKVLEIPLSNSSFLYELPDFALNNSVISKVEKDVQKIIIPKKEIKMTPKPMLPGETIFVGSLASFSLIKGKPTTFRVYSAEAVEVKMVSTKRFEEFLEMNIKKRVVRPVSERFTTFQDFDVFEYTMENDDKKHDISINGLCWMSFTGRGQIIRVALPHGTEIKETLGKIK